MNTLVLAPVILALSLVQAFVVGALLLMLVS